MAEKKQNPAAVVILIIIILVALFFIIKQAMPKRVPVAPTPETVPPEALPPIEGGAPTETQPAK